MIFHHLMFSQSRNAVFAHGGSSQQLRTHLGLYRHSGSGFSQNLGSGATVQLGEELMLRAQVKAGDGKCDMSKRV